MKLLYLIFALLQFESMETNGTITRDGDNDGRTTYTLKTENETFEHVYKEEIINYLQTGTFKYDEDLTLLNN